MNQKSQVALLPTGLPTSFKYEAALSRPLEALVAKTLSLQAVMTTTSSHLP